MPKLVDLTGKRFGRLVVVEKSTSRYKKVFWTCVCDCGTVKDVEGTKLKNGNTQSCGCLLAECVGDKRYNWQGDGAGYQAIHDWIRRNRPIPERCERCGSSQEPRNLYAHNISGEYKRDVDDFIYVCPQCHGLEHSHMGVALKDYL